MKNRREANRNMLNYPPLLDRTGMQQRQGIIVGIAGSIAAGKSTVSVFLTGLGAREIDADAICHKYLRKPEVIEKIIEHFGEEILDPDFRPDRWKLGQVAFEQQENISFLNQVLHPLMTEEVIFEDGAIGTITFPSNISEVTADKFADEVNGKDIVLQGIHPGNVSFDVEPSLEVAVISIVGAASVS